MRRLWRHELATLALGMALLAGCSSSVGSLPANAPNRPPSASDITVKYVVTFYPLWFTHQQWRVSSVNQSSDRTTWDRSTTPWSPPTTTRYMPTRWSM